MWTAKFIDRPGKIPITRPDIRRVERALKMGYRRYGRELTLRLRQERRLVIENQKLKTIAQGASDA